MILATLSEGRSTIRGVTPCEDVEAFLSNKSHLFTSPQVDGNTYIFDGGGWKQTKKVNCGSSAFLFRALPFLLAAQGVETSLVGSKQLAKRSHNALLFLLDKAGIQYESSQPLPPLRIEKEQSFPLRVNLDDLDSSQPLSGLYMALPLLDNDVIINQNLVSSAGYMVLTLNVMKEFGIVQRHDPYDGWFSLPLGTCYKGADFTVEGDWSAAAFWFAAVARGGHLELQGLNYTSYQPDSHIREIAETCGIHSQWFQGKLHISHYPSSPLVPFNFDATPYPDLVPPLVALATACQGKSKIRGVQRLVNKESNRLERIITLLNLVGVEYQLLGVNGEETDWTHAESLSIYGGKGRAIPDNALKYDPQGDHRMVMAATILSLLSGIPIKVEGKECVGKSYPAFFAHLKTIAPDYISL